MSAYASEPVIVIERLCELLEDVHKHLGYAKPRDCFCGSGGFWRGGTNGQWPERTPVGWEHCLDGVEFVEAAVREALMAAGEHK